MIVSDLELFFARERFAALHRSRYAMFDEDEPASVRVLVRLPGADRFPDEALAVALHASPAEIGAPAAAPPPELARFAVQADRAATFNALDHSFRLDTDRPCPVCVSFLAKSEVDGVVREEVVGTASVELADLVGSEYERKEVQVVPAPGAAADGYAFMDTSAEFALEWLNAAGAQVVLEVRVKIDKSCGWPFNTARPFFVLYRWEPQDVSWTPLYRSEVLTKQSDRHDAKGSMIFQMAEVYLNSASGSVDDRPLRLEFFHYKTTDSPKLIGYLSTSLRKLRQSRVGSYLNLELNTFMEGELIGELVMNASRVTLRRSFFSLQAEFGGEVRGDLVYFDLSLTEEKKMPSWRSLLVHSSDHSLTEGEKMSSWRSLRLRPFYIISRYSERGKWEHVYRSELPFRVLRNRHHKYKVAKFTEKKLNQGNPRRTMSIMFYYDNEKADTEPVEIGHIETTVATLLEAQAGSVFPLETPEGSVPGYVLLEQAEESETRLYFAATCVLGKPMSESTAPAPIAARHSQAG